MRTRRNPVIVIRFTPFSSGTLLTIVAIGLLVTLASRVNAQSAKPPASTPPMGWNSWNHFAEKVTDADVRAAADAIVASGMRGAGYIYVNIDDTWEGQRDAAGTSSQTANSPI